MEDSKTKNKILEFLSEHTKIFRTVPNDWLENEKFISHDTVGVEWLIPYPKNNSLPEWPVCPMIWQNKTSFENSVWEIYPENLQQTLEDSYLKKDKFVEIKINDTLYMIDFIHMKQINKFQPDRVREIRRKVPFQWFAFTTRGKFDNIPFDESGNDMIESNAGDKRIIKETECITVYSNGIPFYIDKKKLLQYSADETHVRYIVSVPKFLSNLVLLGRTITPRLSSSSVLYQMIERQFNKTKMPTEKMMKYNPQLINLRKELTIDHIEAVVALKVYLPFMHWFQSRDPKTCQLKIVFHGTDPKSISPILENNFSLKYVGAKNKNEGYYGKGIYFSERSGISLGYNTGNILLGCLVVIQNPFKVPGPEGKSNPYYGKECKSGHDAHYSPRRKEIVIFNTKQILPCFAIYLNSIGYNGDVPVGQQKS